MFFAFLTGLYNIDEDLSSAESAGVRLHFSGIALFRSFRAWMIRLRRGPWALPRAMVARPFRALGIEDLASPNGAL